MMKKSQPKPPVKKYTAQDSVSYERMMDRNFSDVKVANRTPALSKESIAANMRIANRQDSMVANPYYKAKPKTAVNNFKAKVKKK
jgi:hypothetical protein